MSQVLYCRFRFRSPSTSNGEHFAPIFKIYSNRFSQFGYRYPEPSSKVQRKSVTTSFEQSRQPHQTRKTGKEERAAAEKSHPPKVLEYPENLQIKTAFTFYPFKKCEGL